MRAVRGLKAALNDSGRFKFKEPEAAVDSIVIGGGVVGLAIARRLIQLFPSKSTYLVERHNTVGEETSSRNSEVIHSGLYYPPDSLKTRLCLRGRDLLYEHCEANDIPFRRTGKLVVGHKDQLDYIHGLYAKAQNLRWPASYARKADQHFAGKGPVLPVELLSGARARELEPDLSPDIAGALWVPATGIIDSHELMQSLERDVDDAENGALVYSTAVTRIDRLPGEGWVVQTAGGLTAPLILNAIVPESARIPMYFARGSYASYKGPGVAAVRHLIYPCPEVNQGKGAAAFQSLGTHLTMDLANRIKFGPDLEWLDPPVGEDGMESEDAADFWQRHLVPNDARMDEMYQAVTRYLPGVERDGFQPDYVGIRPKIAGPGAGFQDFVIRADYPGEQEKVNPMISLLGIESPGLTSSLALAEYVVDGVLKGAEPANS
uniref:L-2-hydroxyglutarate dehydrogenase, mitochondrial n=1 Tax=Schizophyllum commune (strain H4-8 / FGSC 9210) TaxID=578458 RepID=D8PL23_SCHCM